MTTEMTSVLLVDNDHTTSRTFKKILEKNKMIVKVAESKQEAIMKIRADRFDVVVISLETPDTDGIDLLLFAKKTIPNAARFVTVEFPSLEARIKTLESGADAVFSKPIAPELLVSAIKRIARTNQT